MKPVLTIAICTYNRASYILDCLDSLQNQTARNDEFEILVVNNKSTDGTVKLVESYQSLPFLRLFNEENQGLSHARNAAMNNCKTPWILYLDDDAQARSNMVEIALSMIRKEEFEVFGGVYLPWYKHGRPYWMKDHYVQSPLVGRKEGFLANGEYLSGGIFAMKRDLLMEFGGFKTELGMKGENTAYGEETELQNRLRSKGYRIFFTPDLAMDHLVAAYKLNPEWFFKSAFAKGKDIVGMKQLNYSPLLIFKITMIGIAMVVVKMPVNAIRLFGKRYYMENMLIDTFARVIKRAGIIVRLMENKKR